SMLDDYGLTLDDVENIAFLRGTAGAMFNTLNGVILITTRRAVNLTDKKAINIKKVSPLGYQQKTSFYSPKYPVNKHLENNIPDIRNTLYWNPCIKTDNSGKANFNFYTNDKSNTINVRIEGLLIDGTPLVKDIVLRAQP
ncbi:MAG: hypothetical protein PHX13_12430, partial [Thiovulaceae bacterium]|nr:hypothetical protein [Sulfurimonadaceae bacterium]